MNKHKVIDTKSQKYRKEVGERIKSEREHFFLYCDEGKENEIKGKRIRKRSYDGLSLPEFGKETGIDEDTLYNLETGRAELKVEYLYKICEACGCDISYLLGECKTRLFENNDVCLDTGLTEESVGVLRYASRSARDYRFDDEYGGRLSRKIDSAFIELVNTIIESWYYDDDEYLDDLRVGKEVEVEEKNTFPIIRMATYLVQVRKISEFSKHRAFSDILKISKEYYDNMIKTSDLSLRDSFSIIETCDRLKELGYSADDIREAKDVFKEYTLSDYNFVHSFKRHERVDIQDLFSGFLRSRYFERGENDGK